VGTKNLLKQKKSLYKEVQKDNRQVKTHKKKSNLSSNGFLFHGYFSY